MYKKKLLVISQYFYPEQFRINDICKEWVDRGYGVTVITGIPNYPQGHFYSNYGIFKKKREWYCGIEIFRLPIIPRGKNVFQLGLNYISFVVSGFFWSLLSKTNADYVFVFGVSPMTQALPGVWYAKRKKIPCYLYVQDLWPENVEIVLGIKSKWFLRKIQTMVTYIYDKCDKIFTTSQSFVEAIICKNVDKSKVEYWPQYAEEFYRPLTKVCKNQDKLFTIIYTGNIGMAQGLEILPKAAALLKDKAIHFVIVGDGRYKRNFFQEIKKYNVEEMFEFLGIKKAEEIPELLSKSDVAFLSFLDNTLFEKTIPAKLQSYMACGMPIIAAASGETKKIIEDAKCGICSTIGNAEELALAINNIMNSTDLELMGKSSFSYYAEHFNKRKLLRQMDEYFI